MVVATLPAEKSATNSKPQADPNDPLWSQPIEVLGLTGDFGSGKTIFALSISPGPSTRMYDTEKSSSAYASLGFDRVDLVDSMLRAKPTGHKPIDLFEWWQNDVRSVKPGKYKVIALDCVSEIEEGLVEYVRRNPQEFGYTANQFARAEALMWGCVKAYWKRILSDIAARCETFVFCSHLKAKFVNNAPTREKVAKGKETLMELASLYLRLERVADKKGNVPDKPAAIVLKSRLATMTFLDGELKTIPTLPPRIPIATPAAIRDYMAAPPDYSKLKAGERAEEKEITEEELLHLKLDLANAEGTTESLKLTRLQQAKEAAERSQQPQAKAAVQPEPVATPATGMETVFQGIEPAVTEVFSNGNGHHVDDTPPVSIDTTSDMITPDQIDQLTELRKQLTPLGYGTEEYKFTLAKRGVDTARNLTSDQAAVLIEGLLRILKVKTDEATLVGAGVNPKN